MVVYVMAVLKVMVVVVAVIFIDRLTFLLRSHLDLEFEILTKPLRGNSCQIPFRETEIVSIS